ncbi:MAG: twitching motility protein PilT [Nitrospirales bacterium]|nr:MAG: twitching motility protein PilT [Nitrospirales bacterium]
MSILVDTSIWVDYFRGGIGSTDLDVLIDENQIVVNDLILAELVPFLKLKKQAKVITLLQVLQRLPLEIDWDEIIDFQVKCLNRGANGIGIPDLIITQNAKQHRCKIYSLDKHFRLLQDVLHVKLFKN